MWVGTQNGLNTFDADRNQLVRYPSEVFKNKFVYEILEDSRHNLWFCVNRQDMIIRLDLQNNTLRKYRYRAADDRKRDKPGVISALEDRQGRLWFGTVNDGLLLFDGESETFRNYTVADGLPNNYIYGILEDGDGDLWLSTNKGLSEFDPEKEIFRNYNTSHGIPQNQFNFKSAYKDEAGWMYFGTVNGLCYFHPDSISINSVPPRVYLSGFRLFNKRIETGKSAQLNESIEFIDQLELKASENVITFEFGSIDYFSSEKRAYAYCLEGFEHDWNRVGGKTTATYTNLSPGTYIFKVKAANNDGVWSTNERVLTIVVNPPFWKSAWAFVLYALTFTGMAVLYRIYLKKRQKEKLRLRNILSAREHLKQHFLKFATISALKIPMANKDQDLLKRLTGIVEENMEDSDFNITTFCREAGISRSQLHLKLKKLVNLSASEFVKAIRLQRAVYLITDSGLSISEIAYKVGYSDPNYFTRTFKEKYGSSPTDYRNSHVNS